MSATDFTQTLQKHYNLEVIAREILQETGGRTVFKLVTPSDILIAKFALDQPYIAARIEKDLHFLKTLYRFGLNVPYLIQTTTGHDYVKIDQHILYILTFITSQQPEHNLAFYQKAGQLLGKLHQIPTADYPYNTDFTMAISLEYINQGLRRVKHWPDDGLAHSLNETLERLARIPDGRQALIHTNFFSGNMVMDDEGRLYLVDFDDAGLGDPLLDLGYFIANDIVLEYNGEVYLDPEMLHRFLAAYCGERLLQPEEMALLPIYIYFGVLLYLCDPETGTIYEPKLARYRWLVEQEQWLAEMLGSSR